ERRGGHALPAGLAATPRPPRRAAGAARPRRRGGAMARGPGRAAAGARRRRLDREVAGDRVARRHLLRAGPRRGRAIQPRRRPRSGRGARPRLPRAGDARRGRRPVREGRGPGTRLGRGPRAARRRLRAPRRDAGGVRGVSPRPAARPRVRLALPVRGVRRVGADVAGPLRSVPPRRVAPTCATCMTSPPHYDYARSAALYEGGLRDALHAFKFAGRRALAGPLGDLAAEQCVASLPDGIDALIPVPLARERERERGFNQATLLARRIGRRLGVPTRPSWLARIRS